MKLWVSPFLSIVSKRFMQSIQTTANCLHLWLVSAERSCFFTVTYAWSQCPKQLNPRISMWFYARLFLPHWCHSISLETVGLWCSKQDLFSLLSFYLVRPQVIQTNIFKLLSRGEEIGKAFEEWHRSLGLFKIDLAWSWWAKLELCSVNW